MATERVYQFQVLGGAVKQAALPIYGQDAKPAHRIADTSRASWQQRIFPKLTGKEVKVFAALHEALRETGQSDMTGGELTEWMRERKLARDVNGCRPRLTGLQDKGWIERLPARMCRAYHSSAHPYRPVVAWTAIHDLNPNDGGQ